MNFNLQGVIPPIVTPLKNQTELDFTGLENLIEHIIAGGVQGIFLLGTTGEATSLTYDLRKKLIQSAAKLVRNRVPVVVGVTDTCLDYTLEIARVAKNANLDGVVVAPPYYMPLNQDEINDYLGCLIPKLPLPFLLYNMPSCTKHQLSLNTIKLASKMGAIGIKDSSGDMDFVRLLIQEFKEMPDFSILTGTESDIPETVMLGGHGGVPGGANIFPELYHQLYQAARLKDTVKLKELKIKLKTINDTIYGLSDDPSRYLKAIKCSLSVLGICDDDVASPLKKLEGGEKEKIRQYIMDLQKIM